MANREFQLAHIVMVHPDDRQEWLSKMSNPKEVVKYCEDCDTQVRVAEDKHGEFCPLCSGDKLMTLDDKALQDLAIASHISRGE